MLKPVLAIVLGEAAGIGPEIVAKLCHQDRLLPYCRPILLGDLRVLDRAQKIAGVSFSVTVIDNPSQASWDGPLPFLDQKNLDPEKINPGELSAYSGKATGEDLIAATRLAQEDAVSGFVFGPYNKASLKMGGYGFGELITMNVHNLNLQGLIGEMNVIDHIWTFRVTSHIPIKDVGSGITLDRVSKAILLAHTTMKRAGYNEPRIAVSALNPHGGESGMCGREEIEIIEPAVKSACADGIHAMGPFPADTIFLKAFNGEFDAVVNMYHDQGQIALKLMDFRHIVTVIAGLPYAVCTPAHGTAFDIAGKGAANMDAMERAVIIAAKISGWRS